MHVQLGCLLPHNFTPCFITFYLATIDSVALKGSRRHCAVVVGRSDKIPQTHTIISSSAEYNRVTDVQYLKHFDGVIKIVCTPEFMLTFNVCI